MVSKDCVIIYRVYKILKFLILINLFKTVLSDLEAIKFHFLDLDDFIRVSTERTGAAVLVEYSGIIGSIDGFSTYFIYRGLLNTLYHTHC